jgi:hypothetical protein
VRKVITAKGDNMSKYEYVRLKQTAKLILFTAKAGLSVGRGIYLKAGA